MQLQDIQNDFQSLTQGLGGDVSISFKVLNTSEEILINEDHEFWAASVIKICIAATFFKQLHEGLFNLGDKKVIKQENYVKGSGIAHLLDNSLEYSNLDLLKLMLILSDNAATNEIVDLVGWESVEPYMHELGLKFTTFRHKMQITAGRGPNITTTKDMLLLLEILHHKKIPGASEILEIMNEEKLRTGIPLYLPNSLRIPHKTGSLADGFHDVGIVYANKPFIFCFLSDDQLDKNATSKVLAQMSKLCFDYVSQP